MLQPAYAVCAWCVGCIYCDMYGVYDVYAVWFRAINSKLEGGLQHMKAVAESRSHALAIAHTWQTHPAA